MSVPQPLLAHCSRFPSVILASLVLHNGFRSSMEGTMATSTAAPRAIDKSLLSCVRFDTEFKSAANATQADSLGLVHPCFPTMNHLIAVDRYVWPDEETE